MVSFLVSSAFTYRAYAADGRPKGPMDQMRLTARYFRGEASPREREFLNTALFFTVLGLALVVAVFITS